MRGSGGNRGMMRSVGRTVRGAAGADSFAAVSNPIRSSRYKLTSSSARSLSSTSSSEAPLSIATVSSTSLPWDLPPHQFDEQEWVSVEAVDDAGENAAPNDRVFGPVPRVDEVQTALNALQKFVQLPAPFIHEVSSVGSDPSSHSNLQTHVPGSVYDAFHLLQTEPSVQRMVVSLSSDKAVWDAVLNNEAVQELRESYRAAEERVLPGRDETASENPGAAAHILCWIFYSAKEKLAALLEKITVLVNPLFQWPVDVEKKGGTDSNFFKERLNSSLMISVVILLIVVVTRATWAA